MPRITITIPDGATQPYRFDLNRKLVTIGRGSENDITIDCRSVSVNHAIMKRVEGGFKLRDMDSTNGTRLDGEKESEIFLKNGIDVKVGDVDFDFKLTDEEEEALAIEVEEVIDEDEESDEGEESDELADDEPEELSEKEARPPKRARQKKRAKKEEKPKRAKKEEVYEDDGEGEEPRPKARKKIPRSHTPPSTTRLYAVTLGWIVGAALAFYIGMSIRYQKDTGRSLTPDLRHPPEMKADANEAKADAGEAVEE